MTPLACSRTCALADFPGCQTVAAWQQLLAEYVWRRWESEYHIRTREAALVVNYAGAPFEAPGPEALYRYRGESDNGLSRAVPAVWALGVVDRVDAPLRFLVRADQILRPGGLLFLTFACWDAEGADCASGHTDRARIYGAGSWRKLTLEARRLGFRSFGGCDWHYHGHTLGADHSLASLVLTRRGGELREAPDDGGGAGEGDAPPPPEEGPC